MAKKNPTNEEATAAPGEGHVRPTTETAPDPFTHVGDPHWGQGGRYIVVDGQRVPAPLTNDTEAKHG